MLSGRHCRTSGNEAHACRNPPSNSSSTRILQVHHSALFGGVTILVPSVRTAGGPPGQSHEGRRRVTIRFAPPRTGLVFFLWTPSQECAALLLGYFPFVPTGRRGSAGSSTRKANPLRQRKCSCDCPAWPSNLNEDTHKGKRAPTSGLPTMHSQLRIRRKVVQVSPKPELQFIRACSVGRPDNGGALGERVCTKCRMESGGAWAPATTRTLRRLN